MIAERVGASSLLLPQENPKTSRDIDAMRGCSTSCYQERCRLAAFIGSNVRVQGWDLNLIFFFFFSKDNVHTRSSREELGHL